MAKQVYMTRPIHDTGIQMLKDKGYEVTIGTSETDNPTHEHIVQELQKTPYDAVVTFLTDRVDTELFSVCPSAKLFCNYAVGYNNINLTDATQAGVTVTNTPGTAGKAVAEHTVALMLALTTRLAEGNQYMKAGKYCGWQPELFIGTDLFGKTIGLIGTGDIGSHVAQILAHGFDCRIMYSDVKRNDALEHSCNATYTTQDEIFRTADIVSLHVPLLPSTTHLVNASVLQSMKPSAFLINTARGPVVDEVALVKALQNKVIAGAAVDVYEFEPTLTDGITELDNLVMTPHIASARESVRIAMSKIVAENVISFFETGHATTPIEH